jgi:hypothetical protein
MPHLSRATARVPAPPLHRVHSSVLSGIRYHPDRRVLEAQFRSGRIYHYFEVPHRVYEQLLEAPSIGTYFNKVVKPRFRAKMIS